MMKVTGKCKQDDTLFISAAESLYAHSAGGEDDFEMFLESVKARSLAARTRALPASGNFGVSFCRLYCSSLGD